MSVSDALLSLPNILYAVFGAAFASFCTWAANSLLKRAERQHRRGDAASAAEIQAEAEDRRSFRLAQQSLIETFQRRIKESEEDRQRLWSSFREMQAAVVDCEKLHQADALRIVGLEKVIGGLEDEAVRRIADCEKELKRAHDLIRDLEKQITGKPNNE
jgi:hypothetical protein